MGGQRTKWRRNIAENFNRLSRVHGAPTLQTTDRQTDGRTDGRTDDDIANVNVSSLKMHLTIFVVLYGMLFSF